MFPGFVNTYRDKENHVHLYFFPGIDEHGNNIYNNIDMSEYMSSYTMINNDDNSIDICFYNNKTLQIWKIAIHLSHHTIFMTTPKM